MLYLIAKFLYIWGWFHPSNTCDCVSILILNEPNSNSKMIHCSIRTYYNINPQFKEYINEKQHWNVSFYKQIFEHSYFVIIFWGRYRLSLFILPKDLEILFDIFCICAFQVICWSMVSPRKLKSSTLTKGSHLILTLLCGWLYLVGGYGISCILFS